MLTINDICEHSRRKIGYEQGYISLRIIGEWATREVEVIANEITSNKRDQTQRSLCQLFVDTLCVAHEYYVPMGRTYNSLKMPDSIRACIDNSCVDTSPKEIGEKLDEQVRALYGRLAYYSGWSKPNSDKNLSLLIADIHQTIYAIAARQEIDLVKSLPSFLNSSSDHRALKKFRRTYSPVTTPVLDAFRKIKDNSVCAYAKNSNAWGASLPPSSQCLTQTGLHLFLKSNLDTFLCFSRATTDEHVDAFLIMLPPEISSTIEKLAHTVDEVLRFYATEDTHGTSCIDRIGEPNWRYECFGMKYFVQSFGTCYSADNTRYAYETNQTFIQFVSESAFHRAIPREKWQKARDAIREKAKNTGQEYDVHGHDADTFVHNIQAGMPPVKWYEDISNP